MTTYKLDDMTLLTRLPVAERPFVSWKNVWTLTQVLIVIETLHYSAGLPIQALVVASFVTIGAWRFNFV